MYTVYTLYVYCMHSTCILYIGCGCGTAAATRTGNGWEIQDFWRFLFLENVSILRKSDFIKIFLNPYHENRVNILSKTVISRSEINLYSGEL